MTEIHLNSLNSKRNKYLSTLNFKYICIVEYYKKNGEHEGDSCGFSRTVYYENTDEYKQQIEQIAYIFANYKDPLKRIKGVLDLRSVSFELHEYLNNKIIYPIIDEDINKVNYVIHKLQSL